MISADKLIHTLKLFPHPEGGYFKEIYRSEEKISNLPKRYQGQSRNLGTSIIYLLKGDQYSAFHKIQSDEIWHYYEGDPLELVRRGIEIACAPGFLGKQITLVQELINYRFTNPVPIPQYQAQVAAGAGMAALTDADVDQRMEAIQVPTLILFGEFDRVVPPGNADLMASKISDAQTVVLPACGHIFPVENIH